MGLRPKPRATAGPDKLARRVASRWGSAPNPARPLGQTSWPAGSLHDGAPPQTPRDRWARQAGPPGRFTMGLRPQPRATAGPDKLARRVASRWGSAPNPARPLGQTSWPAGSLHDGAPPQTPRDRWARQARPPGRFTMGLRPKPRATPGPDKLARRVASRWGSAPNPARPLGET